MFMCNTYLPESEAELRGSRQSTIRLTLIFFHIVPTHTHTIHATITNRLNRFFRFGVILEHIFSVPRRYMIVFVAITITIVDYNTDRRESRPVPLHRTQVLYVYNRR